MPTDSASLSQPPTPSISTASSPPRNRAAEYEKFKKFAAYTFLIASPVFIALPPRKLDFYTFSLGAAFVVSANHISSVRTGRGIIGHIQSRMVDHGRPSVLRELPTLQAEAVQAQLRAAREAQQIRDGKAVGEELEERLTRRPGGEREMNIVKKIWMGGEKEGWKERRLREEQRALAEGKGYGDLIKEHIWEVWNWGKKDDSERMGEEQGEGVTKRKGGMGGNKDV
ncbi:hypothetical protein GX48_05871 [Paracoccidioides brasiliensis]|nr:hypothetical protein GX48_05871 [Paracoccidioides brasiliensis]